jgi:hypothetical protein
MRLIGKKRGQQEIVGFVLIVVLVVVALMIFLIISLNKPSVTAKSKFSESFLSSIMAYTTECVVSEPRKETMIDLIESCYKNERCDNLNRPSCDYLNETMASIMNDLQVSDNTISSYLVNIYWEDEEETERINLQGFPMGRRCNGGTLNGEITPIYVDNGMLNVILELCQE